jgi:hypothetical protein
VPVGAWAGGHFEYGHWVVTGERARPRFTLASINTRPKWMRGMRRRPKVTQKELFKSTTDSITECQAKLKNPKVAK